jgi:hypothetical protein
VKDGVGRVRLGVILNLGVPVSRGLRAFGDYCDLGCAIVNRYIHGALRAGQKSAYLLVASGIDTVDASAVRTDFLGHAYYAKSDSIIDDIQKILTSETPPRPSESDSGHRSGPEILDHAQIERLIGYGPLICVPRFI